MDNSFRYKGINYYLRFFDKVEYRWFFKLSLNREEIVIINRIRSDHYNLNQSLHCKGYITSSACLCGDPYQDINHIIFHCDLTRTYASPLIKYLKHRYPTLPIDIFPILLNPSPKLCRLLVAFFKSIKTPI